MLFRNINFPEELIRAQRDGNLVVFAGAGVSMGPPANYPDFNKLAEMVAEGAYTRKKDEPIDRFFGRLESQGVQVHYRAKKFLSSPGSKPNPIHSILLKLFASVDLVRLVTSNFDIHFTCAAKEVFGVHPELFYAPALPLGHQFHGIIYLHGSTTKEERSLVLTDGDFGRAYLTEGWATRFLQGLFQKFTVLFVGYSYNDPVMHYLARGLPLDISNKRFVLTDDTDTSRWSFLNITPLVYPADNNHVALVDAVAQWVEISKMGALDHEHRIKEIVSSPPLLIPEDSDYLESRIKAHDTVQFFTRYAKSVDWLHWVESKQGLKPLFQPEQQAGEVSRLLAYWFSENYIIEYPNESLAIIQRNGLKLHPVLWFAIVERLNQDEPIDAEIFAKWVLVLLRSPRPENPSNYLDYLLRKCRYPEDKHTAILLFDDLTEPRINLEPSLQTSTDSTGKVYVVVASAADDYWMGETWAQFFKPHLGDFAEYLASIVNSHLQKAHLMLRAVGRADEKWDSINYRSAIETHEQNEYRRPMDILIDAARDIFEWTALNDPERAKALISTWYKAGIPILKRLAVYGVSIIPSLTSDEKLAWLLDRDLLYVYGLKHEVFGLLKVAYPQSTEPLRRRLLHGVAQGYRGEEAQELEENTREYEKYNLLVWLRSTATDCPLIKAQFDAEQEKHPDFKPREHPDLDHWITVGDWEGPRSPHTVDELLGMNPEEKISYFLDYKGEGRFLEPDRSGLLTIITETVTKSKDWTWQLIAALKKSEKWDSDIWNSIFRGWEKAPESDDERIKVLTFLRDNRKLYQVADPISDLLSNWIREKQNEITIQCVTLVNQIADGVWDAYPEETPSAAEESQDWLSKAINHPGGRIARIWLHALSKERAEAGESWAGIPDNFKGYFNKILSGSSVKAELGRVVLVSQLHFLFSLDPEWSRSNILPLLDWTDARRSQQAWKGFLDWSHWTLALHQDLMPLIKKSFQHLYSDLDSCRDRFIEQSALVAVYSPSDPLSDGWIAELLRVLDSDGRKSWASYIGRQVKSLKEDAAKSLWNRWLKRYWELRNTGIPLPLSEDEIREMVKWSPHLSPVFNEVVEYICAKPAPLVEDAHYIFHDFKQNNIVATHPNALAKLLLHIFRAAQPRPWNCREYEPLVKSLSTTEVDHQEYAKLCDELARLGCPNASTLQELIRD